MNTEPASAVINFFMLNMPLLLGAKKSYPEALYERSLSAPACISLLISRHPRLGLCEPARPDANGFTSAIHLMERFHPQFGHLQHQQFHSNLTGAPQRNPKLLRQPELKTNRTTKICVDRMRQKELT
jgi:hypothetical protein